MEELTYLKELVKKYDAHYFKGYFGFTLKDIADRMGMSNAYFTLILQGKRSLTEKRQAEFLQAFRDLRVKEKTQDFKESWLQLKTKELYRKTKLLTILLVCANIFTMNDNYAQYINYRRGDSRHNSVRNQSRPIVECLKHSAIGLFLSIYTAISNTIRSIFLSFSFNYER